MFAYPNITKILSMFAFRNFIVEALVVKSMISS